MSTATADKHGVFREAARVLKPGGRLALSDIVTDSQLPECIKCDTTLWAACIGGAMQRDAYRSAIETAGLLGEDQSHKTEFGFDADHPEVFASEDNGATPVEYVLVETSHQGGVIRCHRCDPAAEDGRIQGDSGCGAVSRF